MSSGAGPKALHLIYIFVLFSVIFLLSRFKFRSRKNETIVRQRKSEGEASRQHATRVQSAFLRHHPQLPGSTGGLVLRALYTLIPPFAFHTISKAKGDQESEDQSFSFFCLIGHVSFLGARKRSGTSGVTASGSHIVRPRMPVVARLPLDLVRDFSPPPQVIPNLSNQILACSPAINLQPKSRGPYQVQLAQP